jgi:hypothetical protein
MIVYVKFSLNRFEIKIAVCHRFVGLMHEFNQKISTSQSAKSHHGSHPTQGLGGYGAGFFFTPPKFGL